MQTSQNTRSIRAKDAGEKTASRIRSILAARGFTLHQVARESERLYGPESPFSIPHTLYHSLSNSPSFGPSLPQTCALSRITGYRLEDWLVALGIDLGLLAALQAALPFRRTRLMDPAFDRISCLAGGFEELRVDPDPLGVVPLAQLVCWVPGPQPPNRRQDARQALFARIGCEDAFGFPEVLPGSIVRLNPTAASPGTPTAQNERPGLLLVEYDRGLWCGRFHVSGNGILHAAAPELAYAPVTLRCPQEARILGRVDMEIRWMRHFHRPDVPAELAGYRRPGTIEPAASSPGVLICRARLKAGLTLGEASRLSRRVAEALRDERYAIAQSTLSEYEVRNGPPRHLEKVLALCLIYGIRLIDFIVAGGCAAEHLGRVPIPGDLIAANSRTPRLPPPGPPGAGAFSGSVLRRFGPIPWFLGSYVAGLSGIPRPSLRDFFWLSVDQPYLPAYTGGCLVVLVDRRTKHPMRIPELPAWFQPSYVLLLRGGGYRCACCSLEDETLLLCPGTESGHAPEAYRAGQDAEVVGRIVALTRQIA